MKLYVAISFLIVLQLAVASVNAAGDVLKQEKDQNKGLELPENIFAGHIPRYMPSLNLTTGELKQFAGYSFNLISSKCSLVSKDKLAQINKYVSKLISKTNPVPGKTKAFKELSSSISTCSDSPPKVNSKNTGESSFFETLLFPLLKLLENLRNSPKETDDEFIPIPSTSATSKSTPTEDDKDLKDAKKLTASRPSLSQNANAKEEAKKDEAVDQVDSSNSSPRPETSSTSSPPTGYFPLFHTIFISDSDDAPTPGYQLTSWHPMEWFGGMVNSMRNLFSTFVGNGDGGDLSSTSPSIRAKRSADAENESRIILEPKMDFDEDADDVDVGPEKVPESNADDDSMASKKISSKGNGRDAFLEMIDHICRIYCKECATDRSQIFNFKSAAKDLLRLIFADSTGIELAAKHFLDDDFLDSLALC